MEIQKDNKTERYEPNGMYAVPAEFYSFAMAIQEGTAHRNTPQEALQDVAVIEAFLQSADSGAVIKVPRFV